MSPDHPPLIVRRASIEEIILLRHAVLRPGLPLETANFDGDREPTTMHFGAFTPEGRNIGCASFMLNQWEGKPAYQLRGMSTEPTLLRMGVGRAVLDFAERMIGDQGKALTLWGNARIAAVPFYLRLGWSIASELFEMPGVGMHHKILKHVTHGVST